MSESHQYEKLIEDPSPDEKVADTDANRLIESNTETKYDEDVAVLTDMGFNSSMISKVYIFLRPTSIDQAIQFMTMENGKYQHNFYRQTSSTNSLSNRCFICSEEPKNHHDYVENRSSSLLERIINRKSKNNAAKANELNNVKKPEKDAEIKIEGGSCLICFDAIADDDKFACLKCKHTFCHSCWYEYLNEKIGNAKVSKLTCMQHGCKEILNEDLFFITLRSTQT